MIKSKALSELLQKSLNSGIDLIFICDLAGEILAKEGNSTTSTISDIVSTIWNEYIELGSQLFKNEKLNYLIIENEDSLIIATHLYGFIVAATGRSNIGKIKIHLESIVKFLYEKFAEFKSIIGEKNEN